MSAKSVDEIDISSKISSDSNERLKNVDIYAELTSILNETFRLDEVMEVENEEEENSDEKSYRHEVKKAFLAEHKGDLLTGVGCGLLGIHLVIRIVMFVLGILRMDTWYVPNSLLYYLLWILFPFGVWAWSTNYDYFNFHNRKMRLMTFCVINFSVAIMCAIFSISSSITFPFFASLPETGNVTGKMILSLAKLVSVIICSVPTGFFFYNILKLMNSDMTKDKILSFKIGKKIDIREDKQFSYDMEIVRNLKSGEKYTIKEKDRFLHSLANGTTGTGKTSSCFTCAISKDMEQRRKNYYYQKKQVKKLLKQGIVKMKQPMADSDFDIDNFEAVRAEDSHLLNDLKWKSKIAGITVMAPNAAFSDEIYEIAKANGLHQHVNRLDPTLDPKTGKLKKGFIGFNPLYINPKLNRMQWMIEVSQKALLFADVAQAIYDSEGQSDVYFSSLNRNITTTVTILVILTYPYMPGNKGKQPTPLVVQEILNDFRKAEPYKNKLIELYAKKDESGATSMKNGKVELVGFQFVLDVIQSELLGDGAAKMFDQARGLRIIINSFLTNPLIRNILCNERTIDMDEMLEKGQLTLVNYALEMGSDSKAFGLFFMLSFISAVYRRPGTEHTRIPNFFFLDELPVLLHPRMEGCFSLFRQFRVSMFVAIQSLAQMEKQRSTAFLKDVLMGNCAHHFVFGRVAPAEMKVYQELAGTSIQLTVQEGVKESPFTADNPTVTYDNKEIVKRDYNIFGSEIRNMDFQEVLVVTVDNGSPVNAFFGKVSFLPKYKRIRKPLYRVDWSKYQPYLEAQIERTEVTQQVETKVLDSYKTVVASDSFYEEMAENLGKDSVNRPAFWIELEDQMIPEENSLLDREYKHVSTSDSEIPEEIEEKDEENEEEQFTINF